MGIENLPIDVDCDKCGKEFKTTAGEFQDAREARNPILCPDCYVEVLDKQAEMERPLRRCWEYKYYTLIENNMNLPIPNYQIKAPSLIDEKYINKLGANGWELIVIFGSDGIFKREYFSDIKPLVEEEI